MPGCGRFWNRSAADFYDLVDATTRAIKAYDPTLQVGTCGVAAPMQQPQNPYSFGLIQALGARATPVDFFSWHTYSCDIELFASTSEAVRAALDAAWPGRRGADAVASHVTEWFPGILTSEQDTAHGAASFAGSLTRMVQTGVRLATLYPLCSSGEGRTGGHGWGLFDQESRPGVAAWRRLTYAFQAFGEVAQTATEGRLLPTAAVTVARGVAVAAGGGRSLRGEEGGPSSPNFTTTVLAGRSASGSALPSVKALIVVQNHKVCNGDSRAVGRPWVVAVAVEGLPAADVVPAWQYSVSVIDSDHAVPIIVAGGVAMASKDGVLDITFPLQPPAVARVWVVAA